MFGIDTQQQAANQPATMQHTTAVANERGQQTMLAMMMNPQLMQGIDNLASLMAEGTVSTPQHLRGKKADCFAICLQAMQWGMNPFPVMQKTHLVNGVLGYEAQLVNAVVVNSGAIKGRFSYRKFGPWDRVLGKFLVKESNKDGKKSFYRVPNWSPQDEEGCGVEVSAVLANGKTETIELMLTQARTRNSTLWADDPYQQLCYLGVKRWTRLYTPDVILGVYTVDELQGEVELNPIDTGSKDRTADMAARAEARRAEMRAAQQRAEQAEVVEQGAAGQAQHCDTETGEIYGQDEEEPSICDQIKDLIKACKTLDDLSVLKGELSKSKNLSESDKAQIQQAYNNRGSELTRELKAKKAQ